VKTYLDCYACFIRQALDGARFAGADEAQQQTIIKKTLQAMLTFDPACTPPELASQIQHLVHQETGDPNPYRKAKESSTKEALDLYSELKTRIANASDPLDCAIRVSIAGNIIDLGALATYNLWETIERVLSQPFAIDDKTAFYDKLAHCRQILYLADNAGETVFDRLLIERLPAPVTYAVKAAAMLNDATIEDAEAAGLHTAATLVSTGADALGTPLQQCSPAFRTRYEEADLIIAKGQANYETLSPGDNRIFFLLQVKCPIIARDAGAPTGSIILKQGNTSPTAKTSK